MGRFQNGHKKVGGKKKGQPNHQTVAVKAAIEQAFNELDGVAGLIKFAKQYPIEFYRLWGKLLPITAEVSGSISLPLTTQVNVLYHAVAAAERPAIRGDEAAADTGDAAGHPEPPSGPSPGMGV